jgi:hypothetical protein
MAFGCFFLTRMSKLLVYPLFQLFGMPAAKSPELDVRWDFALDDHFLQRAYTDPEAIREFLRAY